MVLTIHAYDTALAAARPSTSSPYSAIGSRIGRQIDTIQPATTSNCRNRIRYAKPVNPLSPE
jgi:hypothetical protein